MAYPLAKAIVTEKSGNLSQMVDIGDVNSLRPQTTLYAYDSQLSRPPSRSQAMLSFGPVNRKTTLSAVASVCPLSHPISRRTTINFDSSFFLELSSHNIYPLL